MRAPTHSAGVKRLPVVDETGRLVGIVSRADLLKIFTRPDEAIRSQIIGEVVAGEFMLDPSRLFIQVDDGVVLLQGKVERSSLVPYLVRAVRHVEGVVRAGGDVHGGSLTAERTGDHTWGMEKFSLEARARVLMKSAATAPAGRAAETVYGGHEHVLRQTLIALTAGTALSEHENPGEATLQVLAGRVRLVTDTAEWHGRDGDLIIVPQARHTLHAVEDSAVLLTVAKLP
jgi:quercetin dioxygenase-like cupin family protein